MMLEYNQSSYERVEALMSCRRILIISVQDATLVTGDSVMIGCLRVILKRLCHSCVDGASFEATYAAIQTLIQSCPCSFQQDNAKTFFARVCNECGFVVKESEY